MLISPLSKRVQNRGGFLSDFMARGVGFKPLDKLNAAFAIIATPISVLITLISVGIFRTENGTKNNSRLKTEIFISLG
jgi:hypothetical protein